MASYDSPLSSRSDKLKKAITWVSETLQQHPEKSRETLLQEALVRHDLSPADCEFLIKYFS